MYIIIFPNCSIKYEIIDFFKGYFYFVEYANPACAPQYVIFVTDEMNIDLLVTF